MCLAGVIHYEGQVCNCSWVARYDDPTVWQAQIAGQGPDDELSPRTLSLQPVSWRLSHNTGDSPRYGVPRQKAIPAISPAIIPLNKTKELLLSSLCKSYFKHTFHGDQEGLVFAALSMSMFGQ